MAKYQRPAIECKLTIKAKNIVPGYAWAHEITLTPEEFEKLVETFGGKEKFQHYMDTTVPLREEEFKAKLKELEMNYE